MGVGNREGARGREILPVNLSGGEKPNLAACETRGG